MENSTVFTIEDLRTALDKKKTAAGDYSFVLISAIKQCGGVDEFLRKRILTVGDVRTRFASDEMDARVKGLDATEPITII